MPARSRHREAGGWPWTWGAGCTSGQAHRREGPLLPAAPRTCLSMQCAAVTTQRGASTEPPHVCREPRATLACQGQRPGATACPPTIRAASGLAPHSANREAPMGWMERTGGWQRRPDRQRAGPGRIQRSLPPKHGDREGEMWVTHLPAPSGREHAGSRDRGCVTYGAPTPNETPVPLEGSACGWTSEETGGMGRPVKATAQSFPRDPEFPALLNLLELLTG